LSGGGGDSKGTVGQAYVMQNRLWGKEIFQKRNEFRRFRAIELASESLNSLLMYRTNWSV
jgi:hypothetical protein